MAARKVAMLRKRKVVEARIAEMRPISRPKPTRFGAAIRIQASVASGRSTARAAQALGRHRPATHRPSVAMETSHEHGTRTTGGNVPPDESAVVGTAFVVAGGTRDPSPHLPI
jgi:hypothetical protein